MNDDSTTIVGDAFAQLEEAWNAADGSAFGRPFTADADFVDVRGELHRGVGAIGAGHQGIFDSVYKGSTVKYTVLHATPIADGCLLGHVHATLDAPSGPLQGVNHSTITAVVVADGAGWKIRAFHNTLVPS